MQLVSGFFTLVCVIAYVAAVPAGSFTVHNNRTDSYVVRFKVIYFENTGDCAVGDILDSKDITAGKKEKIEIPGASKHASLEDVSLNIQGFRPNNEPNTILDQSYPSPVHKCFKISGTDMQPTWAEVPC